MNKITNMKNLFLGLILAILIFPLFTLNSFATVDTSRVDPITGAISNTQVNTNTNNQNIGNAVNNAVGLPPVTMDDMTDLVERKTYDVVNLLQVFVKPFSVICFIGCAIMTLIGAFGHGGYVGKGLIGMFVAGMIYTAVMYAPELVQFFSTWLLN